MTTSVVCTVPQGLKNLPLGVPNNLATWNGGPYSLIDALPPSSFDPTQGFLLDNGGPGAAGAVSFTFTVNAQAWTAFIATVLGAQLTTAAAPGVPAALIAAN
jgi:hypothetical protein